jgi:hypothetical protein
VRRREIISLVKNRLSLEKQIEVKPSENKRDIHKIQKE